MMVLLSLCFSTPNIVLCGGRQGGFCVSMAHRYHVAEERSMGIIPCQSGRIQVPLCLSPPERWRLDVT